MRSARPGLAAALAASTILLSQTGQAVTPQPDLVAVGTIPGNYEDFALQTAAPLENGIAGNLLGGMGSGLAYAGHNTFIAIPDRGPNAAPYNAAVDDTASYIPRFQTLHMSLAPSGNPTLPFTLTPMLTDTTLLSSESRLVYGDGAAAGLPDGAPALNAVDHTFYFSGRSDNFDPSKLSTNPRDARFDPEGVRVSRDGRSVFITDEYGPFVYEFDRSSGRRIRVYQLPDAFGVSHLSAVGNDEISGNTSGRVANKGMEGLAITPDGRTIVGIMQSPLIQDGGGNGTVTRIVTIDVESGRMRQFGYRLDSAKFTVSEILAVNDHVFLVDERDGKGLGDGSTAVQKKVYRIDLWGARDISNLTGEAALLPFALLKTEFLDIVTALGAKGIPATSVPAKLEGMAFGPDVKMGSAIKHTLFVSNDNDFSPDPANPNKWLVFAFDDDLLPGFEPQRIRDRGRDGDNDSDDRSR